MKILFARGAMLAAMLLVTGACCRGQSTVKAGKTMHATGSFDVQITPAAADASAKANAPTRMLIEKQWSGGIVGTSSGEMLSTFTSATGAMAYVALEHMDVTIDGHHGTFLFQHGASMLKGGDASSVVLKIDVVPNSGTDALKGISGSLAIDIVDKVHHYDFTYSLPAGS